VPLSRHYGGRGSEVMRGMKRRYGSKAGERIFYATERKRKKKRGSARDELARKRAMQKQSKRHRRRR
jgi:hypothetical protein